MEMEKLKERILKRIKPTPQEEKRLARFSETIKETANAYLSEYGGETLICGSTGKGTWLRGDHDIDLFMVFPKGFNLEDSLDLAKKIVRDLKGKYQINYAQHPYLKARINGFNIDLVPCHRIQKGEKIISAVDRSPLHLQFVISNLDEKMRDEVRIAKKFLKGIDAYGSDLRRQGLSGYTIEVLISRFKSFENLLEFFSKMEYGEVVGKPGRVFNDPLVVVDPIDPDRNTAASLSVENFSRIRFFSGRMLEKPSERFFREKGLLTNYERKRIAKRRTRFAMLRFTNPGKVEDILYPQLRKIGRKIRKGLESRNIHVVTMFEYCGRYCYIIFEYLESGIRVIRGPEKTSIFHARRFSKKHEALMEWKNTIHSIEEIDTKREMERLAKEFAKDGFTFLGFSEMRRFLGRKEFDKAIRHALFLDMPWR